MVYSSTSIILLVLLSAPFSLQAPTTSKAASVVTQLKRSGGNHQHPSLSERTIIKTPGSPNAKTETLSELVNKRPHSSKEQELQLFIATFAQHAKVKELDRHTDPLNLEALKKGWTKLRREEKGYYNPKQMEHTIEDHLRQNVKLSESAVKAVRYHWKQHLQRDKASRFRSRLISGASPEVSARYEAYKQSNRQAQKDLYARRKNGESKQSSFQDLMAEYGVERGLSAKDLEERSRVFRHRYQGNPGAATMALKHYMEAQKYNRQEIDLAIGVRSEDLKRAAQSRYAERKSSNEAAKSSTSLAQEQVLAAEASILNGVSQSPLSRKRKIQEWLDSNKDWHSTSHF